MNNKPLSREERVHLFSPRVREFGKTSWIDVDRYEATVQAAEERAERLRAGIQYVLDDRETDEPLSSGDVAEHLRAALAADDAERGEG